MAAAFDNVNAEPPVSLPPHLQVQPTRSEAWVEIVRGRVQHAGPVTAESLAAGAQSYTKTCALCHGATGNGDGKLAAATAAYGARPSNLTDDVWDHGSSDGEIFSGVKNGTPPELFMGPWDGRLTDTEMWNVVNYVRSLAAKKK